MRFSVLQITEGWVGPGNEANNSLQHTNIETYHMLLSSIFGSFARQTSRAIKFQVS